MQRVVHAAERCDANKGENTASLRHKDLLHCGFKGRGRLSAVTCVGHKQPKHLPLLRALAGPNDTEAIA
jgi:hypothetical protein